MALKVMGGAFSWSESEIVGGGIVKYGSQVRDGHVGAPKYMDGDKPGSALIFSAAPCNRPRL